jgi:hypothetical protein
MKKLRRFHKDIFYPDWFEESIDVFTKGLDGKQLICSYHATKRYESFSRQHKKVIRDLLRTVNLEECKEYIFEFCSNDNNEIKKVCYRFPTPELESDIIFVISSNAKVVTIFLNRNFDPHVSLQKDLYQQGEN